MLFKTVLIFMLKSFLSGRTSISKGKSAIAWLDIISSTDMPKFSHRSLCLVVFLSFRKPTVKLKLKLKPVVHVVVDYPLPEYLQHLFVDLCGESEVQL